MAKNLYGTGPGQKQVVVVHPRPKGRKRFRWWLIWLPTSILCLAWLASGIHVGHAQGRNRRGDTEHAQVSRELHGLAQEAPPL